ncbi:hypothetical protein [Prosthecobacter sp.]|uniref:hypothetical protein n=1 Tax=Prosthecobacter sp. TaxID=1965333 RepID=UPI003782FBAE
MNNLKKTCAVIVALGGFLAAASSPEPRQNYAGLLQVAQEEPKADKDVYERWSVVGEWQVTHPYWTDVLTLNPNGTAIARDMQTTAKWTLTAEGGTPLLVLRWDAYGTESLAMVGPNHFRGQIAPESFMDMRRGEKKEAE